MADETLQAQGLFTVNVPDVGEGVAEVEIVSWAVAVGDTVDRLQTVAEVMTDKATVEVPSPVDGVVAELGGQVGDVLLVGSPLIRLSMGGSMGEAGAPPPAEAEPAVSTPHPPGVMARPHATGAPMAAAVSPPTVAEQDRTQSRDQGRPRRPSDDEGRSTRPLATPAVRRRARDAGVDLRVVVASGPAGRITHDDLDRHLSGVGSNGAADTVADLGPTTPEPRISRTGVSENPVVGLRRKIAEQMVASTSTIPHITYVEEVDVTALEDLRATLNEQAAERSDQPRLTLLPFLVRALTNALIEFPHVNAHLIESDPESDTESGIEPDLVRTFDGVHVGIATQTANGLVVPVVRHAESHTIWTAASAIADLSEATRSGTATAADLSGSTITITSLGPLGGVVTTPVINKPEVAIIGVNKIVVRPVWIDGEFVPRKMMNLSSSFDHRVIDGWDAANFIQAIRIQLEQPALLFVDGLPGPAVGDVPEVNR